MRRFLTVAACTLFLQASGGAATPAHVDRHVRQAMAASQVQGLALAYIDQGKVAYTAAWGVRNAAREPLTVDTIMYGASLTKTLFAYAVMQLAAEGKLGLDQPFASHLGTLLPDYADHLSGDARWRRLTPRHVLTHSSGFANFAFLEADGKLRFHFEPGTRYAYSGEGMILLQLALERGLGLQLGPVMQRRIFDRFGMKNSSMRWRPDFAANLADGWDVDGKITAHDERSRVRAAGSLDTTITDMAAFAAALIRGDGLDQASHAEMLRPQLPITTESQFPTLQAELPPADKLPGLAAGLGVITLMGPQGKGFFKGGHNDTTGNMLVCLESRQRCVVLLANDVRAESLFPAIVRLLLGETGMPWTWEYGKKAGAVP